MKKVFIIVLLLSIIGCTKVFSNGKRDGMFQISNELSFSARNTFFLNQSKTTSTDFYGGEITYLFWQTVPLNLSLEITNPTGVGFSVDWLPLDLMDDAIGLHAGVGAGINFFDNLISFGPRISAGGWILLLLAPVEVKIAYTPTFNINTNNQTVALNLLNVKISLGFWLPNYISMMIHSKPTQ